jgi:hypothetical protein
MIPAAERERIILKARFLSQSGFFRLASEPKRKQFVASQKCEKACGNDWF